MRRGSTRTERAGRSEAAESGKTSTTGVRHLIFRLRAPPLRAPHRPRALDQEVGEGGDVDGGLAERRRDLRLLTSEHAAMTRAGGLQMASDRDCPRPGSGGVKLASVWANPLRGAASCIWWSGRQVGQRGRADRCSSAGRVGHEQDVRR
jgi:hypothetical protein